MNDPLSWQIELNKNYSYDYESQKKDVFTKETLENNERKRFE